MEELVKLEKGGRYVVCSEYTLTQEQRSRIISMLDLAFPPEDDIKFLVLESGLYLDTLNFPNYPR